jgi:5-methyltetrahydrofolate--homocysteine methyltransferase
MEGRDGIRGLSHFSVRSGHFANRLGMQERVVIVDAAMGAHIQLRNPSLDDFQGKEGYNDILVLSRPDIIQEIHAAFFEVGCDVVEPNRFISSPMDMAEHDMLDQVRSLNAAAAKQARSVADDFSSKGRRAAKYFVA